MCEIPEINYCMLSLNIFCDPAAQKFDTGDGCDKIIGKHPVQDETHNLTSQFLKGDPQYKRVAQFFGLI